MPRFAANLSMLYNEVEFLHRFAAAADDGFKAVEYLFPYSHPAQELAAPLPPHAFQQIPLNSPPPPCPPAPPRLAAGALQCPGRPLGRWRARPGLPARAPGRVSRSAGAGPGLRP